MKNLIVYRCQNCGGAAKILGNGSVRELVLSCTGQIEVIHILRPFEDGEAGVCVVHCDPEKCRTLEGSSRAVRRVNYAKKLLKEADIDEERVKSIFCTRETDLKKEVTEFAGKIKGM
jgi:coenzyme F420-reducing hydrogenase delta subunit